MIGTGAISLFAAATQWFIMVLLGLPLALPLAVLAFFLGFIPYIGSIVATGLAFLVTFAVGSTQDIAIMAVFTIVFNIVQGNVVAPLVYGKAVNLHPAIVLGHPGGAWPGSSNLPRRPVHRRLTVPVRRRPGDEARSQPRRPPHANPGGRRARPSTAVADMVSPRPDDVARGPVALDASEDGRPVLRSAPR
jgi:hypothetical protein